MKFYSIDLSLSTGTDLFISTSQTLKKASGVRPFLWRRCFSSIKAISSFDVFMALFYFLARRAFYFSTSFSSYFMASFCLKMAWIFISASCRASSIRSRSASALCLKSLSLSQHGATFQPYLQSFHRVGTQRWVWSRTVQVEALINIRGRSTRAGHACFAPRTPLDTDVASAGERFR